MKEEYDPKTAMDKFKEKMKKKFETKEKDKAEVKKTSMGDILKTVVQFPEKLFLGNSPDMPSAKPYKKGENPLQTGPGKQFGK